MDYTNILNSVSSTTTSIRNRFVWSSTSEGCMFVLVRGDGSVASVVVLVVVASGGEGGGGGGWWW